MEVSEPEGEVPVVSLDRKVLYLAAGWALLNGVLTVVAAQSLAVLGSPVTTTLILPGVVAAMVLAGNVHGFMWGVVVLGNVVFHFAVSWIVLRVGVGLLRVVGSG